MKNKFEIQIGEIEGLEFGQYEYKITLDKMEQYLYETDTFEIQGEGNFSFGVLHNNMLIGGFKIPISSLKPCSSVWFPIENPYTDLQDIPYSTESPRISMSIRSSNLFTVPECSEKSNESPIFSPRIFSRNNILQALRLELQRKDQIILELETAVDSSHNENNRLQSIVEEIAENFYRFQNETKDRLEFNDKQNNELQQTISDLQIEKIKNTEETLMLKRQIEILHHKLSLKEITSEKIEIFDAENILNRLKDSENKRKDLQQVLNSSNNKWHDVKTSNNTLAYLEKENKQLINKVKTLSELVAESSASTAPQDDLNLIKQIHELSSRISGLKQKNKSLKSSLEAFEAENNQYKEIIEHFRNEISKQEEQNSELSGQLKSALAKLPHREEKIDVIDKALKEFLKEHKLKNPFVKISEGIYNFGNKRLCFSLKNGFPVVRVGGGYMFVDEFLKMYNSHNKKKDECPIRSQSLEGKINCIGKNKPKPDPDAEVALNDTDSSNSIKQEIKILKKVPRRVFIP
jgi:hypothetical protein